MYSKKIRKILTALCLCGSLLHIQVPTPPGKLAALQAEWRLHRAIDMLAGK